jgi:hypothetical protein
MKKTNPDKYINRSKRAEETITWTTVAIVLAGLALLIVIALIYGYSKSQTEKGVVTKCQQSVMSQAESVSLMGSTYDTKINCPTINRTLDNSDKSIVAEDIHLCWYEFSRGKLRLNKDDVVLCHICNIYNFDSEMDGLMRYLMTTKVKNNYLESLDGVSYFDYLNGFSDSSGPPQYLNSIAQVDAFPKGRYAVVFYSRMGSDARISDKIIIPQKGVIFAAGTVTTDTRSTRPLSLAAKDGAYAFNVYDRNDAELTSYIMILPYSENMLSDLKCTKVVLG